MCFDFAGLAAGREAENAVWKPSTATAEGIQEAFLDWEHELRAPCLNH